MPTHPPHHSTDANGGRHSTHVPFRLSDEPDDDDDGDIYPQMFLFDPYYPGDDDA